MQMKLNSSADYAVAINNCPSNQRASFIRGDKNENFLPVGKSRNGGVYLDF